MAIFKNTSPIVTDGLVLYLDAANRQSYSSGSAVWNDLSGNKLNGVLTPTVISVPLYNFENNGIRLYGTSGGSGGTSIIFSNNNLYNITTGSYTIDITLSNITTSSTDEWVLFNGVGTLNGTQANYGIRKLNSRYRFYISDGVNIVSYDLNTVIRSLTTNIIITFTYGGVINFFTNGIIDNIINNPYAFSTSTRNRIEIGGLSQGGGTTRFFNGTLYNIKLYNRVFTHQEVLQNYNATKTRFNLT